MVAEMLRENAQEVENIHTENIHTFQLLQSQVRKVWQWYQLGIFRDVICVHGDLDWILTVRLCLGELKAYLAHV